MLIKQKIRFNRFIMQLSKDLKISDFRFIAHKLTNNLQKELSATSNEVHWSLRKLCIIIERTELEIIHELVEISIMSNWIDSINLIPKSKFCRSNCPWSNNEAIVDHVFIVLPILFILLVSSSKWSFSFDSFKQKTFSHTRLTFFSLEWSSMSWSLNSVYQLLPSFNSIG